MQRQSTRFSHFPLAFPFVASTRRQLPPRQKKPLHYSLRSFQSTTALHSQNSVTSDVAMSEAGLGKIMADGLLSERSLKFYDGTYKWNTCGFIDDKGGKYY